MTLLQAVILGAVEGLTEFLPVSSTGHLILASAWMGLHGEAAKTFVIVIQAGALAAVLGLYGRRLGSLPLLKNLAVGFLPAGVAGLLLHRWIKEHLFGAHPVVVALAAGGLFMIGLDRWRLRREEAAPFPEAGSRPPRSLRRRELETLTPREAFLIGVVQCLALWPGTSRSMVTISAGLLLGLSGPAAARFSFLLALPTLGAAVLFDAVKNGDALLQAASLPVLTAGFAVAAVTAALAMRGLVAILNRSGLAPFGWYRLGLALAVFFR